MESKARFWNTGRRAGFHIAAELHVNDLLAMGRMVQLSAWYHRPPL